MSFGLVNAPSVFSRLMQIVLGAGYSGSGSGGSGSSSHEAIAWKYCLVYIDDVIIFSATFQEHLHRLRLVFDRFRLANLTLKPSKCCFGKKRIKFLGHYVSEHGIEPMPEKCAAIKKFPTPTKVRDVRSFLGLAGYYRKFIKDFSKIAGPLIRLTKKDEPFEWAADCEEAFQTLKDMLTSPPVLAYPNYQDPYLLQTDASGEAIGMILSQIQDGHERVIAYAGKRLTSAEMNYSTTEKEALAVIEGLKHFDPYLRGSQVTIVTDHSALTWLLSQREPRGRIARWVCYLQQFNYNIIHKDGRKHANADALSRIAYDCVSDPDNLVSDDAILPPEGNMFNPEVCNPVNAVKQKQPRTKLRGKRFKMHRPPYKYPDVKWTMERIRECQLRDKAVAPFLKYLETWEVDEDDKMTKEVLRTSDSYVTESGVLYHLLDTKSADPQRQIDEIRLCLVVPEELKHDVLTSFHGDLNSGHYGIERTYTTMRLKYFWKGMYNDCKNWVLSCENCNTRKAPVQPTKAELHPLPPIMMNERWAMDIVTLPLTPRGNRYVLVFTEYNSRFAEAFALPNTQATTIARTLVDEICFRYGSPQQLLSDLGANLISQVVAETCQIMGIERLFTSPYRPQTDGLVERLNSTICKNLAMYVNERHDDWDLYLKAICFSYNTSTCIDSTQYSPFFVMYGREPFQPLDTILTRPKTTREEVKETVLKVQKVREIAKENLTQRQRIMKEKYDQNIHPRNFEPGELVWIYFPDIMVGGSRKFFHNWSGPYILSEKTSPTNFKVAHAHNNEQLKNQVHVNRMKPFHHRSIMPPQPSIVSDQLPHEIEELNPRDISALQQGCPPSQNAQLYGGLSTHQPSRELPSSQPAMTVPTCIPGLPMIQTPTLPVIQQPIPMPESSATQILPDQDVGAKIEQEQPQRDVADDEYEINRIVKAKYDKDGTLKYLIDWKGYPASARTYEPYENLNDSAKEYVDNNDIPTVGSKKK